MTSRSVDTNKMANPAGAWLRLSAGLTRLTENLSNGERRDITVSIAPDAGWGSPAAFLPPAAGIEIDAKYWPEDFDIKDAFPYDHRDWQNYPAIMGLLAHEVAHTQHSDWAYELKKAHINRKHLLSEGEQHALGAAELLEESRIEELHLGERPQDTPWVQASATTIALADAMGDDRMASKKAASRVASLVLARASAGSILPSDELDQVKDNIIATLGAEEGKPAYKAQRDGQAMLDKLTAIWTEYQNTPDDDTETFMRLGKQWYDLTQDDGSSGEGEDGQGIPQALKDALEALAGKAMGEASGSDALGKLMKQLAEAVNKKVSESKNQKDAKRTAEDVFHGNDRGEASGLYNWDHTFRQPTTQERQLAHKTARKILKAYIREKAVTVIHSDRPPGRLRPSTAMQGDAQKQMGMYPNVEPFTRRELAHTPSPPLKVGIVVDTSDSQDNAVAATVSGAYSLAAAIKIIPDGSVAMVNFGEEVQKVIAPWDKVKGVPNLRADGGTDYMLRAMKAVEGELNLMRKGSARLLVIITDGFTSPTDLMGMNPMFKRYLDAGVRILFVVTGYKHSYPNGQAKAGYYAQDLPVIPLDVRGIRGEKVHVAYPYTDSDLIPKMICDEAVKTLEQA
jgi:hypothetical protein